MPQILRPYQKEAVELVLDAIADGKTRVLYTAATGTGKTSTFAELVRRLLFNGSKVLVLAHRTELISQAYERIKDHCGLHEWEIGTEIASYRANATCRVIVGSVQTCMRVGRPVETWLPDAIISDEAHHCAAKKSYGSIYARYGVNDGRCIHIGCTATAKRTDRLSLYAEHPDGSPVILERKGKPPRPATYEESVFQQHVYEYGVLPAVEEGWLVPLKGHTVQTATDINAVKTTAGDFQEDQLAAAVDTDDRTLLAINAWKQIAADRPTLVFCASVEHAHHAAALWTAAGYTASAVDGKTDSWARHNMFADFAGGRLRVLCNMGVATEGVDLPNCSCIIHLRPTKSWNLYTQMTGRGTRPLPKVLDGLDAVDDRLSAIQSSGKPDCLILDMVDLYDKCGDICTVPSILDLPVKLDLQGHSVTEAKRLLDQFKEVREQVIGECPTTYKELAVRLEQVNMMRNSGARSVQDWKATDNGYRFTRVPPGYQCELLRSPDGEFRLDVRGHGQQILYKRGRPGKDFRLYMDFAAGHAREAIAAIEAGRPKPSRGTASRLTEKQLRVLTRHGHRREEVDSWPIYRAHALIKTYVTEWRKRQDSENGDF